MVGTNKWTDAQVFMCFEAREKGFQKWQIADRINEKWPRRLATSAGVNYVLNTKKREYRELKRTGFSLTDVAKPTVVAKPKVSKYTAFKTRDPATPSPPPYFAPATPCMVTTPPYFTPAPHCASPAYTYSKSAPTYSELVPTYFDPAPVAANAYDPFSDFVDFGLCEEGDLSQVNLSDFDFGTFDAPAAELSPLVAMMANPGEMFLLNSPVVEEKVEEEEEEVKKEKYSNEEIAEICKAAEEDWNAVFGED